LIQYKGGPALFKILIVEDSKFVRMMTAKLLQEKFPSATILAACDPLEGYDIYQSEKPDLIITDLLMPNMNGQEFIQQIRQTDSQIPVIVLSADIQQATRDEMEQLGILTFINKPLSGDKTVHLINTIKEIFHA